MPSRARWPGISAFLRGSGRCEVARRGTLRRTGPVALDWRDVIAVGPGRAWASGLSLAVLEGAGCAVLRLAGDPRKVRAAAAGDDPGGRRRPGCWMRGRCMGPRFRRTVSAPRCLGPAPDRALFSVLTMRLFDTVMGRRNGAAPHRSRAVGAATAVPPPIPVRRAAWRQPDRLLSRYNRGLSALHLHATPPVVGRDLRAAAARGRGRGLMQGLATRRIPQCNSGGAGAWLARPGAGGVRGRGRGHPWRRPQMWHAILVTMCADAHSASKLAILPTNSAGMCCSACAPSPYASAIIFQICDACTSLSSHDRYLSFMIYNSASVAAAADPCEGLTPE